MTLAPKHYDFDDAFQQKIAASLMRDSDFARRTDGLVRPEYFENECDAILVSVLLAHFGRYGKVPSDSRTLALVLKEARDAKIIRDDIWDLMKVRIVALTKTDTSDKEFIIDKVAEFAKHQALANALVESAELLDKRDFDKIGKKLTAALETGSTQGDSGLDYFDTIEQRTMERKAALAGTALLTGITTGVPKLDNELYHKGWGRKELSVLMGAAKAGKTTGLIFFGLNAAIAGYNVLYASCEVAGRIIAERLDASVSEIMYKEMPTRAHEIEEKVKKVKAGKTGCFKIHEFPTGTLTCADLKRLLRNYAAKGITFDMVIVDYADIMAPERFSDSAIENSKSIYVGLRAIAQEFDVAMLTATQTNRDGAKATVARMTDVAEDFNKVRIADIVISINSTETEREDKEARLFFAASRNQAGGVVIRVKQALERGKFITSILDVSGGSGGSS